MPITIGTFYPQWAETARRRGDRPLELPIIERGPGQPAPDGETELDARTRVGRRSLEALADHPAELLLDDAARGLQFVPGRSDGTLELLHERLGVPLFTRFVDPAVGSCLGRLERALAFQTLLSNTWWKLVWDRAQADEMTAFGVPNVVHQPMAAPDGDYDTSPIDPASITVPVSFVGAAVGRFFQPGRQAETGSLVPGLIAHAARATRPDLRFYDVYHDLYKLAEPPGKGDSIEQRVHKLDAYLRAKVFYMAGLLLRQRDRFVMFLSRQLGEQFHLHGPGWDEVYGLTCRPPLSDEEYLAWFRRCLINVNVNSGQAETGVNLRTFEITAAGGFLLCQHQPELADLFEVGRECESFHDEVELLEKCSYYLAHPRQALEIARAGQERTLSEHLYSHRYGQIVKLWSEQARPAAAAAG